MVTCKTIDSEYILFFIQYFFIFVIYERTKFYKLLLLKPLKSIPSPYFTFYCPNIFIISVTAENYFCTRMFSCLIEKQIIQYNSYDYHHKLLL